MSCLFHGIRHHGADASAATGCSFGAIRMALGKLTHCPGHRSQIGRWPPVPIQVQDRLAFPVGRLFAPGA